MKQFIMLHTILHMRKVISPQHLFQLNLLRKQADHHRPHQNLVSHQHQSNQLKRHHSHHHH